MRSRNGASDVRAARFEARRAPARRGGDSAATSVRSRPASCSTSASRDGPRAARAWRPSHRVRERCVDRGVARRANRPGPSQRSVGRSVRSMCPASDTRRRALDAAHPSGSAPARAVCASPAVRAAMPTARRQPSKASSTSASQNSTRTGRRRGPSVVALETAVDARIRDIDRHALRRPARHHLERWPDDADKMSVVLPAEIRFDLAAVVCRPRTHNSCHPCTPSAYAPWYQHPGTLAPGT